MAARQYLYFKEGPKELLTPCISTPSTTGSLTLSTTSFSYDSPHFSAQLTKISYSKEVVKSSTLPSILETRSGASDVHSNGSAREQGNEINGKYDAGKLYRLQPAHTDEARRTHCADDANEKCMCYYDKISVPPNPVNFPSAVNLEIEPHMKNSAMISPMEGDKIVIERNQAQLPWFSDHTPVLRTEETKENSGILGGRSSHSIHKEHTAFLCSLSAVFASIDGMDRNIDKERLIKIHTSNSTCNELFSVHPSKSIPIVFTPREDKIPIESVNDTPASDERGSVLCPRYGTSKRSSYFIPQKVEKTELDADLRRQASYNSDIRNNDIHPVNLSTSNIQRTNIDLKIPQEIYEIKKGVSHPITNEILPPISSLRVANYPRKKENMRYMRKKDVEFPDLASFEPDQFRNYIPYPISPFSQKDIFEGSITDKEFSREDTSVTTALTNDSCALNSTTPYSSPTELTRQGSVQNTNKSMSDLKYSIFIEIAPAKSSSHPLISPVENETEEINKFEDLTSWDDEELPLLSETDSLKKSIKDNAAAASKGSLNSTILEGDVHPIVVSKTNGEQCELTQETDVVKKDISYSVIIEISTRASTHENSTLKTDNVENSDQCNKQTSDSVDEELKTDYFLHFPPPQFLKGNSERSDLEEATQDICGSPAHKSCTTQTSIFEESMLNQEYSTAGRSITKTETLESTMVENSALNTIYSLYSRLPSYADKDEGNFADSKILDTKFIYPSCVEENRLRSHSPSDSPPTEPEQSIIESDSVEEQIVSTFSSFFNSPEVPSDEDGMEHQSKGEVSESDENASTHRCESPPCITTILSSKDNTKQTQTGELVSKFNHFKTTYASSSDASVQVQKEENDSKDKIVSAGRKKALSPYPPVVLSSQSISTSLFRGNNENEQITGKWSLSGVNNIAIPLSCTSTPEVSTSKEIDNKSKDSILPMGRKKKLSSSPPVVHPPESIPELNTDDSDYWAVAARYYSKHDNVEILYSSSRSADGCTKEKKEKNSKDKTVSLGRKMMLSPHPPVTPPLHTKLLLLESSDMETNSQVFISRGKFGTPFTYASQFTNEEGEENRYKDPVLTTGRKMRLCPYSHGAPPPVSQSTSLNQSSKEDIPKDKTMAEGHYSRENNFGMTYSNMDNVSPPDVYIDEEQSKGSIFATGRKKSLTPYPPEINPSQNVTRRPPHQVSENAENNVARDNIGSLTKSMSAPDISTNDIREENMQESGLCTHPTMTLPLNHIPATQLKGKSKENVQTNEGETISRGIYQEKYGFSLSAPNIKIRRKKKEKNGRKRKLFSSPPSTSIPLDLQQQDNEESASKEGMVESKEIRENSVKNPLVLPQRNPTYNFEEWNQKDIDLQLVDLMVTHEIVSLPVPLPIERMNGNKDEEINSKLPATVMKLHSLPTLRPQICNIPPYRRKSETQMRDTTCCVPTTPRSQSISESTRSLVSISQARNEHPSKQDLSGVLASQNIVLDEEEQVEELVYKRTFTSFDTRLSSLSTSKTLSFASGRIEDEREHLANSHSEDSSPTTEAKRICSLTKVEREKLKSRSDERARNINEDDKPDGELTRNISSNIKYFSSDSGRIIDERSTSTNKRLSTSSLSHTRGYSSMASPERKIVSKEESLVKTKKRVDSLDQEISHHSFSPHSTPYCNVKNKNYEMSSLEDVTEDKDLSQSASRPPSVINYLDADRKKDRQDNNSDFLRVRVSQVPLKSLTSSRRPSPYEIAPPVLETTPRAPKVSRTDSHVKPPPVIRSPPPAVPYARPPVVRALPPKVEPVPVSRVDLSSIRRPESNSVDPLTPPPVSVALAEAVALDDAKEVVRLLRIGIDPNSTNQLGIPVLVEAVHLGSLNAAAALLSCGTSPNARAPGGRTALHAAADVGRHQCVSLLLRHGAHVNAVDKYKQTSLHLAARGGHNAAVLALMEGGADSRLQDANGDSVVQVAHDPELRRLIRRKTIERLRRKCQMPP